MYFNTSLTIYLGNFSYSLVKSEICLTLRSLKLFWLSGLLCCMSDLKDAVCVVKPINLADSHPAAFVWTKELLVQCNELPFRALMSCCGERSWNSALNFATIFYVVCFFFLIAHFRAVVCGIPERHESHELAYKLGFPNKAVRFRCICGLTRHCALYPSVFFPTIFCLM